MVALVIVLIILVLVLGKCRYSYMSEVKDLDYTWADTNVKLINNVNEPYFNRQIITSGQTINIANPYAYMYKDTYKYAPTTKMYKRDMPLIEIMADRDPFNKNIEELIENTYCCDNIINKKIEENLKHNNNQSHRLEQINEKYYE